MTPSTLFQHGALIGAEDMTPPTLFQHGALIGGHMYLAVSHGV
jgi:hypothetical protein